MSAGTGVTHSEFNLTDNSLRFLQIWIKPDRNGYTPNYGDYRYEWQEREGKWLRIASGTGKSKINIHQDMELLVLVLKKNQKMDYDIAKGRQVYLIQIEGSGSLNDNVLLARDAAEIIGESHIELKAKDDSHYILFDMKAEK